MKTYRAKPELVNRKWYIVDATDKVLGRLATQVANVLNGKTAPDYTPNVDTGDFVVVINADKIKTTGRKLEQKMYYRHSTYPGGFKSQTLKEMLTRSPEKVLYKAVKGMLPKNRLSSRKLKRLRIYAAPEHPHTAQKPEVMEF
jgi:large subunit ribosomal protein L13